jgi:hypothetical protein
MTSDVKDYSKTVRVGNDQAHAKQIVFALNGAYKKINMYPVDHVIYNTALKSLYGRLSDFFDAYGSLELEIDRDQVRYNGHVVFKEDMSDENPAFIMFRDGINRIEFKTTLALSELHGFLEILKNNQIITEESETDIVTDLWETHFPSLLYQVDDVGFDTGEEFQVPDLYDGQVPEDSEVPSGTGDEYRSMEYAKAVESDEIMNLSIKDQRLWELTPEDWNHLQSLVAEEETRERIEYVLDILLYILQHQTQLDNFSDVIDNLKKELQSALKDCKFQSVYNTLDVLKQSMESHKLENHWSISCLDDFFTAISDKVFLNSLNRVWQKIDDRDTRNILFLKRIMLLLKPDAIHALGPMLLQRKSSKMQKILMSVIAIMAEKNFAPMEALLTTSETVHTEMLVHIMGYMKSKPSWKSLLSMLHHESAEVRKKAFKALTRRNSEILKEIFWLIDDPDDEVRRLLLRFLGRKQSETAENFLINYLAKHRIHSGNKQRLFTVYGTLGHCGSDRSLAFLKKDLYLWPRLGILRSKKSPRRQVAIYALKKLKTNKAEPILKRINV